MDALVQQLNDLEAQKAQLFEQDTVDHYAVAEINNQIKDTQANIEKAQQEQLVQKQEEYTGGLKEMMFQIFDSVLPKETATKLLGLSEYEELAQGYRQLVDVAIDENNANLYAIVGEQMETKDAKIREVTTKNIDLDTQLQEAVRKEQSAQENYIRSLAENERIEQDNVRLANIAADKDVSIAELNQQLEAKDEQIAKLTDELSKPKVQTGFNLNSQAKPSQSLADMMNAAKEKAVKSQIDIALSGSSFRGKVELTPITKAVSEPADTFRNEAGAIIAQDNQLPVTESTIAPPALPSESACPPHRSSAPSCPKT